MSQNTDMLRILLRSMEMWRKNWNVRQDFSTKDIDHCIGQVRLAIIDSDNQSDDRTVLLTKLAQLEKENNCLRAIASKIMPCHYCGIDNISKCPSGFPGCALMDDVMVAGDTIVQEYRKLKAQCEKLESLGRHHDLCRKALSVPENEPILEIKELLERKDKP